MRVYTRNDGAVGNTLEALLGIRENNLPIPNAREWELKGQRKHSASLLTLKHIEPSPTAAKIVSNVLLPFSGWKHKQAGKKYPRTEMSFRSTTGATSFTNRGFRIVVDRGSRKVRFIFDPAQADISDHDIREWLASVRDRVGLRPITPEPYWGFDDLNYAIGAKIMNCFYVIADTKIEKSREFFRYECNLKAALALHFAHYNFVRVHQTLGVAPAVAAGLEIYTWTLSQLVETVLQ